MWLSINKEGDAQSFMDNTGVVFPKFLHEALARKRQFCETINQYQKPIFVEKMSWILYYDNPPYHSASTMNF